MDTPTVDTPTPLGHRLLAAENRNYIFSELLTRLATEIPPVTASLMRARYVEQFLTSHNISTTIAVDLPSGRTAEEHYLKTKEIFAAQGIGVCPDIAVPVIGHAMNSTGSKIIIDMAKFLGRDVPLETVQFTLHSSWSPGEELDEVRFAAIMHELGHALNQAFYGEGDGETLLDEIHAWEWAIEHTYEWTPAMRVAFAFGIGSYLTTGLARAVFRDDDTKSENILMEELRELFTTEQRIFKSNQRQKKAA